MSKTSTDSSKSSPSSRKILIKDLSKFHERKGNRLHVVDKLSFDVGENEFLCIVGPSGCGKSTLLSIIAGLDKKYEGEMRIDGGSSSRMAFVFQSPRLLPWSTVYGNVKFGIEASKSLPAQEWEKRIADAIQVVGLQGFESSFPNQLSGGMQTRVGIARALAIAPDVLLMDEPFSHLDEINARKLRKELLSIWTSRKATVVFVTHDIDEAVFLADRVILLTPRPAKIFKEVVIDAPRPRTYANPNLLGYANTLLQGLEEMLEKTESQVQ